MATVAGTSYDVSDLTNGTPYFFMVKKVLAGKEIGSKNGTQSHFVITFDLGNGQNVQ